MFFMNDLKTRKTSDAQIRATKKYQDKFYEVRFRVLPELHDSIVKYADEAGQSVTAFLIEAVNEKINRIEDTREKSLDK